MVYLLFLWRFPFCHEFWGLPPWQNGYTSIDSVTIPSDPVIPQKVARGTPWVPADSQHLLVLLVEWMACTISSLYIILCMMLKYSYVNVRFSISSTRFVRPRWATRGACARTNRARMAVVAVVLGSCSSPRRGVDGDFKMSFVIFLYALWFMLKYVLLELSFCIVFMYYWICTIGFWLIFLCD